MIATEKPKYFIMSNSDNLRIPFDLNIEHWENMINLSPKYSKLLDDYFILPSRDWDEGSSLNSKGETVCHIEKKPDWNKPYATFNYIKKHRVLNSDIEKDSPQIDKIVVGGISFYSIADYLSESFKVSELKRSE